DRVGRAVDLGQDVLDAAGLQHFADAGAGLHAGAGAGRDQDHAAGAVATDDAVRNGRAAQRDLLDPPQRLLAVFERLLDRRRDFVRLAVAPGHLALLVADDDQRVEAEPPAALNHGSAAADLHHEVLDSRVGRIVPVSTTFARHV